MIQALDYVRLSGRPPLQTHDSHEDGIDVQLNIGRKRLDHFRSSAESDGKR